MTLIVHVTESLGGGVAQVISQLAQAQQASGFDVMVLYSRRVDTPSEDTLEMLLPEPIRRASLRMVTVIDPARDLLSLCLLVRWFRQLNPDIIHLHSSKAGILGRVSALLSMNSSKVFYSPHGFAFLRSDVSKIKRDLYLFLERCAAYLPGSLIACSGSELELARAQVRHKRAFLVENSIDLKEFNEVSRGSAAPVRVVTSGRLSFQKAPWRFQLLAEKLSHYDAEFIWVGGGDIKFNMSCSEGRTAKLRATGWVSRDKVLEELSRADIFVMTSLWEGMPLSLIEAQAAGLPAVVPDIVGCRDVVLNNETGFICHNDGDLLEKLEILIKDDNLRLKFGKRAREIAVSRFDIGRMHTEMLGIYSS